MAGVVFFFEQNDVDVWSGRPVDLDAWALACLAAGDIDRVVVVNRTNEALRPFVDRFEVVSELPDVPDLERYGWRHRSPLASVLHEERYGVSASVPTA